MNDHDHNRHQPEHHTDFSIARGDPLIDNLHKVIRQAVRVLAVLMVMVILWGIGDVAWVLYQRLMAPPFMLLAISDILATFGAFLAVLIAIEIFVNITMYLRDDIIHVKLVIATALMAIARKVIVFDFNTVGSEYVWATAAAVLALGITYWLVSARACT
ncbi:MAG: phosphate-starvation-inducible PsiE family protein [Gammaproteobacteria bacterium]